MKSFRNLRSTVLADDARRARVEAHKAELVAALSLADVRRARDLTQEELADALRTTQSGVSRIEHESDLYVSTLRKYVEAAGGKLEIHAVFTDARVSIRAFSQLGDEPD